MSPRPPQNIATGYAHARYAESLAEFGRPRELSRSRGWILERGIPGTADRDAMGCYPLFACADWSALRGDLDEVGRSLVSIVVVADPFGNHDPELLAQTFNQGAVPFKEHQVVHFSEPLDRIVSSHHRRNVRKALRVVHVERLADPVAAINEWSRLYGTLIERHSIGGIRAFSNASFAAQLSIPGIIAFRAEHEGETVGMLLFYARGELAYYHLGAYSERGYALGAAFAAFWTALQHLAERVRYVSLGGNAGLGGDNGGLARFKRGWANETRQVFLCKHIGDPERYAKLSGARPGTTFFPAYRADEMKTLSGDGGTP